MEQEECPHNIFEGYDLKRILDTNDVHKKLCESSCTTIFEKVKTKIKPGFDENLQSSIASFTIDSSNNNTNIDILLRLQKE